MAMVLAACVLVLTLIASAVIGFGNGMRSATTEAAVSPWPVLIGGSLIALLIALTHGLHW
jgi:hypothetical protein